MLEVAESVEMKTDEYCHETPSRYSVSFYLGHHLQQGPLIIAFLTMQNKGITMQGLQHFNICLNPFIYNECQSSMSLITFSTSSNGTFNIRDT